MTQIAEERAQLIARMTGAVYTSGWLTVSQQMVEVADVLIGRETYPEVDMAARGKECADVLVEILREAIRPTMALHQIPLVWGMNQITAHRPMSEAIDELHRIGFDPQDEGSVDHAARALQRLANDREFLGDLLLDMLAGRAASPQSGYGPQAIVLSPPRGEWFLRANIWPSERDTCLKSSGAAHFVYGAPHDHNFDFLTVGYFGPSYVSDYYE
mgnify:CR=1 FL=1